jgi:hypothetical protein
VAMTETVAMIGTVTAATIGTATTIGTKVAGRHGFALAQNPST